MKLHLLACLVLLTLPAFGQETQEKAAREAVPAAAAQEAAEKLIKDIFKTEYASRLPDKRRELAQTLLSQSRETVESANTYVLLREARDIAASVGDLETMLAACDALTARFEVRDFTDRLKALETAFSAVRTPEAARQVLSECSFLADKAQRLDDFDTAAGALALAEKTAIKIKDLATVTSIRKRKTELAATKTRFLQFSRFEEALKADPTEPKANLETGRYLCFIKEDWLAGLPRLAKCNDEALQKLAAGSLQAPEAAKDRAELASHWWDYSEKLEGGERAAIRRYAGSWFRLALPELTGLTKSLAEKRLEEVEELESPSRHLAIDLIALLDKRQDVLHGDWEIEKDTLRCTSRGLVPKVRVPYTPPEEYDIRFIFSQPKFRNGLGLILPNRNGDVFHVYLLETGSKGYGISVEGRVGRENPTHREYPGAAQENQEYSVLVQVRKNEIKLLINGKLLTGYQGDFKSLKTDSWHQMKDKDALAVFCDDPTTFRRLELVEVSGPGKRHR